MPSAQTIQPLVLSARERLADGRSKLEQQHRSGSPGPQTCARWTELVDALIVDLWKGILQECNLPADPPGVALVAHGGHGRGDLAPYSDADLMLLHRPEQFHTISQVARLLSQWLVDAGLQLGFSVRTPEQALGLAWKEAATFTSLLEGRCLTGDEEFSQRYHASLRQGALRRSQKLIDMIESARLEERKKFGETVYLLQPNIKRSRGGLRDIQLVRWVGFARYGEAGLEQLQQLGYLEQEDYRLLRDGYHFLLRLRNQLHFDARKCQDVLDRAKQVHLASWAGFTGEEGVLPVEQFMRRYFEHTSSVRYCSAHFVASSRVGPWWSRTVGPWFSVPSGSYFRVGFKQIWATPAGLQRVKEDPGMVIELMALANRIDRRIDHETWRAIRKAMLERKPTVRNRKVAEQFLELLRHPARLGEQLRRLHELRVLEQIIPAFQHARCLLQFNEFHKYTVDAHCIRAVELCTEFLKQTGPLAEVYRAVKNKSLLHLALLLHDIGKGYSEDHSEVGKRIAQQTAEDLGLSEDETQLLVFLVHKHLVMTHTAFRYDLSQIETILQFAKEVQSVEALQMLYLLSAADMAAVGPEGLSEWRLGLLTQLYHRTESQFRDEKPDQRFQKELDALRDQVRLRVGDLAQESWWRQQIDAIPVNYLLRCPPEQLAEELARLQSLNEQQPALAWAKYNADSGTVEYSVAMQEPSTPIGIFHRITGALSSQGLQILTAEVHTQPGQIAWDRFEVEDLDFEGSPPQSRMDAVCQTIVQSLDPSHPHAPAFRTVWRKESKQKSHLVRSQPTLVQFDNNSSERFTIISVFAYDRLGLLYAIAKVLFDQGLDLQVAKISTHLDQVVDVFYVTDFEGRKIEEPTRLYMLRQKLLAASESS